MEMRACLVIGSLDNADRKSRLHRKLGVRVESCEVIIQVSLCGGGEEADSRIGWSGSK